VAVGAPAAEASGAVATARRSTLAGTGRHSRSGARQGVVAVAAGRRRRQGVSSSAMVAGAHRGVPAMARCAGGCAQQGSSGQLEEGLGLAFSGLRGLLIDCWWVIVRLQTIFRKIYRISTPVWLSHDG
jgi:hypothetical protein